MTMEPARMSRRPIGIAIVLIMSLAWLAACGDGGGSPLTTLAPATTTAAPATTAPVVTTGAPTTTPVTDSVTTAPPTTAPTSTESPTTITTEALSSAETRLPNGDIKGMGFIREVGEKDGVRYLKIDYAEFLTGEEARQAALDAGEIQPGEDLPNDYYIRNVNPMLREFAISASVAITTATRAGGMDEPASWAEFLSFWGPAPAGGASHLKDMPWWIVRTGNVVHTIDEQYLP